MARYDVPATPENYTIWYAYVAGSDPELVKALNVVISNHGTFTPERNAEIYERFFSRSRLDQTVQSTGEGLESAMTRVLRLLGDFDADQTAYGHKLAQMSGALEGGSTAETVQAVLRQLRQETRAILVKNQELEHRLARSKREIEQLRQNLESVRRDALTDPLTGIANRKQFDQRLREACAAALEDGGAVALVMVDIDHFKAFNDRFGHRVGDEVLKLVARHLRNQVKGRDTPARYGGEEFALILPSTTLAGAGVLAEQIRKSLAEHSLTSRKTDLRYGKVTLSLGIAVYQLGERLDDLLQRADRALYLAKDKGRNRVCTEADLPADAQAEVPAFTTAKLDRLET
ncbi:GGDEF domain-containing protein [Rhodovibrio salinarum]|nr:GGDEF domain-containing protein [Rhodovibrio salinarum]